MAQTFKAKTLLAASGRFSHEAIAPNLVFNTGDQNISGIKNFYSRPTVNGTGVLLSGEAASLPITIVYITGDQIISGIKNFTNNLVLQDNLLQSSQASGYLTGIGYSGNYDGGYFLGRTKLSQNTSRLVDSSFGNTWVAKESNRNWYGVAISSDGKYQTAIVNGGQIYISSDYGNSWTAKESNRNWYGVAISSDGKYQTAIVNGGQIYISSDYGNSWTAKESNRNWFGVAMSSDGKYQTVIINGGLGTAGIYVSINYGNTWTAKESNRYWYSISMSSDGKYQTAVVYAGKIYISSDYGNSWVAKESDRNWDSISISSDGKYQTATVYAGKIYISSDYGNSWVAKESDRNWDSISISSDGKYQTATVYAGKIYISSDYGNTWVAKESNRAWSWISMSSDGKYQTALVGGGGYIYVSKTDELIDGNLYVDNFYATSGFFSGTLNASNLVYNTGNQTISGVKNFASRPTVNGTGVLLSGEAASLPITIVYTTGDQAISGNKTFNNNVIISENLNVTGSIRAKNIIAAEYENLLISGYSSSMFGTDINIIPGISPFSIGKINLTAAGDQVQGNINLKGNVDVNNYGNLFSPGDVYPSGLGHKFTIYKSGLNEYNQRVSIKSFEVNQSGVYTLNKTPIYADGQIYISGNPILTGVDLSTYATVANLALTGSTLDNKINSLSGNLTSTYATISNLSLTGSNLDSKINSLSGNLTSTYATINNLTSTGSILNSSIISLSGLFTGYTGNLDTIFASDAQLFTTGSTLDTKINSLSGNLTSNYATITNLASTGSTLNTRINNLSGYINSSGSNIVFTTGNQNISGNKSFYGDVLLSGTNNRIGKGYYLSTNSDFVYIRQVDGRRILDSEELSLFDTDENRSIDWAARYLYDPNGAQSIGWDTRELLNKNSIPVLTWTGNNIGIGTNTPSEKLTVVGNILANNLVYNTGNQTISGVKTFANGSNQILNTTYSTLTGLKATSGLLSGQLYRISDFVLKWNNQSINDQTVKTAASGEPLIVTALSNKQIYPIAQSEIYPQDTIYYNIDASTSYSWGAINNNVSIPDFKGWIYRRVDNLLNIDIPYDWRNITVNCCKPDVSSVPNYSGNYQYTRLDYVKETGNNSNRGKLYYSAVTGNSGNALNNSNFWLPVSAFVESGTFFSTDESYGFRALYDDVNLGDYRINLPALTSSRIQQPTFTSILTGLGAFTLSNVKNIKIEGGYSNVIIGDFFQNNTIGNNFYLNTIGLNFYHNTIGNSFVYNTIGVGFYANIIGEGFSTNTIGASFQTNNIGISFNSNTIGESFFANTMGYAFSYNTIGSSFGYNNIGNISSSNTITSNFYNNNIGNNFSLNTVGTTFSDNTIGNIFQNNNIANSFTYNTIGNYFEGNTVGTTFNLNNIGNIFQNNNIQTNFNTNTIANNFNYNTIGNSFNSNTIANAFEDNTIGNSFEVNTIGNYFYSNTIGNGFFGNTAEGEFNDVDFSTSTHVYNTYNTTLFSNSALSQRLRYFNSSDQLVVTDPTA